MCLYHHVSEVCTQMLDWIKQMKPAHTISITWWKIVQELSAGKYHTQCLHWLPCWCRRATLSPRESQKGPRKETEVSLEYRHLLRARNRHSPPPKQPPSPLSPLLRSTCAASIPRSQNVLPVAQQQHPFLTRLLRQSQFGWRNTYGSRGARISCLHPLQHFATTPHT